MSQKIYSDIIVKGGVTLQTTNAATDTDKFLVQDVNGTIKFRTGSEVLNDIGAGTGSVVSVSLILGTAGTDVNSSVATATTTPAITLNIPTSSATNRGLLSSTDWSLFSGKQGALTLTTTGTSGAATLVGNTLNIPQYSGGGVTGSSTIGYASFWTSTTGIGGSSSFFWDNTNKYLGIGTNAPQTQLHVKSAASVGIMRLQGLGDADNYSVLEMWDDTGASKWQFAHKLYAGQTKDFSFTHWNGTSWITPILFKDNGRILINKTTGDDGVNQLQINGYTIATGFRVPSGASTGFLKADGTVDSSTYLTSGTVVSTFSGGTTGLTPSTATSGAITLGGTLIVGNGGTGSTTAAGARTNLGATTIGSNLFTSANPTAIRFLRTNADNTVSWLDASTYLVAIGAYDASNSNGYISSVNITDINATGIPDSTTYLRGDGTWSTVSGGGGTPAGVNGEIQYNSGGSFGASADFVWDNTLKTLNLLGTDTDIVMKCTTNEPPTPAADTLAIYTKKMGGKAVVKTRDEFGVDLSLQTSFWDNNVVMWNCTNAAGGLWLGTVGTTVGTFANTLPTSASLPASIKRSLFSNVVTTTNQALGVYGSENLFMRGPTSAFGGFYFYSRFTFDVWSNGGRLFTGLSAVATATAIITSNPSTATNIHTCGFAVNDTDAGVIFFITNNGTTTTKQIVTGIPPIISNRAYDAYIYCAPGGSTIYWKLEELSTNTTASGSQTLTLPSNSTTMRPYCVASNAALTPVNSIRLGVNKIYLETDY